MGTPDTTTPAHANTRPGSGDDLPGGVSKNVNCNQLT
jgi:hypothetical protein